MTDVWPCRYEDAQVAASSCDNLDKGACTAAGGCSWCESAAVGNACYTKVSPDLRLPLYSWMPMSSHDASIGSAQASFITPDLLQSHDVTLAALCRMTPKGCQLPSSVAQMQPLMQPPAQHRDLHETAEGYGKQTHGLPLAASRRVVSINLKDLHTSWARVATKRHAVQSTYSVPETINSGSRQEERLDIEPEPWLNCLSWHMHSYASRVSQYGPGC